MPYGDVVVDIFKSIPGLKFSHEAIRAAGIQHGLAAHLALQCNALDQCIILRAGSSYVFNQKRAPKSGLNLTKTSNQGLLKGSIALDYRFSRVNNGIGRGTSKKDSERLGKDIRDPNYQHTVTLSITMQDILREITPEGDLKVLGYENGKLRLAYKDRKGARDFKGQFVIDLHDVDPDPIFYSRPWDHPKFHPLWDDATETLKKPEALDVIPEVGQGGENVYQRATKGLLKVHYTEEQSPLEQNDLLEPVKVFASTPKTSTALLNAIFASGVLDAPEFASQRALLASMNEDTPMWDILHVLTPAQVKAVYDHCGLIVTGDWDGLALGHPTNEQLQGYPIEKMRVYNTFAPGQKGVDEISGLVEASCSYFRFLAQNKRIQSTALGDLLKQVGDPTDLLSPYAIAHAGCITPHEFVFQQLINYSTRDSQNTAYGEPVDMDILQVSFNAGLQKYRELKPNLELSHEEKFTIAFQHILACKTSLETPQISATNTVTGAGGFQQGAAAAAAPTVTIHYPPPDKKKPTVERSGRHIHYPRESLALEHLSNHLKIAIQQAEKPYTLPHPDYDHNIHDLFQHGFEMRNPYGANPSGPWLLVLAEGMIIYGENETQLTQVLLQGDILKNNIIDVPTNVNMAAGWGAIIEKQLALGQEHISSKTMEQYQLWRHPIEPPDMLKKQTAAAAAEDEEKEDSMSTPVEPLSIGETSIESPESLLHTQSFLKKQMVHLRTTLPEESSEEKEENTLKPIK